jgi:hypothetical protein
MAGVLGLKNLLFLKKKKQKDFYSWCCGKIRSIVPNVDAAKKIKVFWFFFSKKNCFLS